jgi:AraC family transcriptional regulator, transcriptional activator FtrA
VPMGIKTPDAEQMVCGWRIPGLPGDEILEALRAAADNGARMVSFCSGAFVLAEAGLLDGRRATTHWMYLDAFRARYPRVEVVPDVLWVDEGDRLTSAGSASGMDLSLHIVRTDHGADAADLVARRTVVPPHRDGGQAQYTTPPPVPSGGTPFAELLDWMVAHLDQDLPVGELAERAAMSERTFARRFRDATGATPHQWLTAQRVARARQLLETTDLTVDAVAARSGLGTAVNLRARLRDAVGVSPSAYRGRFSRTAVTTST